MRQCRSHAGLGAQTAAPSPFRYRLAASPKVRLDGATFCCLPS
jgi:hypothetical protein